MTEDVSFNILVCISRMTVCFSFILFYFKEGFFGEIIPWACWPHVHRIAHSSDLKGGSVV